MINFGAFMMLKWALTQIELTFIKHLQFEYGPKFKVNVEVTTGGGELAMYNYEIYNAHQEGFQIQFIK